MVGRDGAHRPRRPRQAIDRGALLSDPSDPRDGAVAATGTPGRRPRTRLLLLLALAVLALDLVTKLIVVATIERGADIRDRKSTRLNSSHANISYAVFCLKKKKLY